MIDGLHYWDQTQMEANCRTLCDVNDETHPHVGSTFYVLVPYPEFAIDHTRLDCYEERVRHNLDCFLVQTQASDQRHFLFGFATEADRDALFGTPGIFERNPRFGRTSI